MLLAVPSDWRVKLPEAEPMLKAKVEVAVAEVTASLEIVVVAKLAWLFIARLPVMSRLPARVEVAVADEATKAEAVEVAEVDKEPVKVMPPLAVRAPVKVEAPVTARVPERVAAPATLRLDDKVAAPATVKGAEMVVVPRMVMVSEAPPPKEAFWEETVVKEPSGAFREEPTMGPVEDKPLVLM